jgi:hypothetical protein
MKRPKPKKPRVRTIIGDDDPNAPLSPPMTAKEKQYWRRLQNAMTIATIALEDNADQGVPAMVAEIKDIFTENRNRTIRAYRDGKITGKKLSGRTQPKR